MFLRKTLHYTNKNILYLLLLSLPAAACFTLGGKPLTIIELFVKMFNGIKSGQTTFAFSEIFNSFSLIDIKRPLFALLFIAGIFLLGILFSVVERNMKYDTVTFGSIRAMLLDALFITLPAGLLFLFAVELVGLIASGFIALFSVFGFGWGWFVLSAISTLLIYYAFISFVCYLFCWIPCVSMEALKFFTAASLSSRMLSKFHTRIFLTVVALIVVLGVAVYFVTLAGLISYFSLCAVLNVLLCVFLPSYCYAAYFTTADIPLGAKKK